MPGCNTPGMRNYWRRRTYRARLGLFAAAATAIVVIAFIWLLRVAIWFWLNG
jgi:hypothetical protein